MKLSNWGCVNYQRTLCMRIGRANVVILQAGWVIIAYSNARTNSQR